MPATRTRSSTVTVNGNGIAPPRPWTENPPDESDRKIGDKEMKPTDLSVINVFVFLVEFETVEERFVLRAYPKSPSPVFGGGVRVGVFWFWDRL
jgi:hypothetical protein